MDFNTRKESGADEIISMSLASTSSMGESTSKANKKKDKKDKKDKQPDKYKEELQLAKQKMKVLKKALVEE